VVVSTLVERGTSERAGSMARRRDEARLVTVKTRKAQ